MMSRKKLIFKKELIRFCILIFLSFCTCINYVQAFAALPPVTSPFGWRNDPISGEWKFHAGVDFGLEYGTAVYALFDGTVADAGNHGDGYGNQVLLYHSSIDAYTRYAHCSLLYVSVGQEVVAGDMIGLVGSTGRSTGPHLHLEYIIDTTEGYQYTDPLNLWEGE